VKTLNLKVLNIEGTQSRVRIDEPTVAEYAEAVTAGVKMPPVVVFHDGVNYWLADGFHRVMAYTRAGKASIEVDVRSGTQRDAVLHSVGANSEHGLRRTNDDKRKSILILLRDKDWGKWSDRKIGEICRVHHTTVATVRHSMVATDEEAAAAARKKVTGELASENVTAELASEKRTYTTKHGTQAEMVVKKKGTKKAKRTIEQPPAPAPNEAELRDTVEAMREEIDRLEAENAELRERLAVESMDVTEEGKLEAAKLIAELKARVKMLELEVKGVKGSRDILMVQKSELLAQVNYWKRKAKAAA
jgi:ParB-like chromosome segregation protein Spo0J